MTCGNLFLQINRQYCYSVFRKLCLFEMFIFSFIIEKITLCFVLPLYDKNRFIFTIFILFVLFCIPGTCVFYNSWKIFFFSICDQIINFYAAFWGRFLQCGRVTMNKQLNMIRLNGQIQVLGLKNKIKPERFFFLCFMMYY